MRQLRAAPRSPRLSVPGELALGERAERDDALRVARADRGVCERDRRAGAVAAAAERLRGEGEVAHAERGAQSHGLVAFHVRDDTVDVAHRQSRVSHRVLDRDARELELALGRAAPLVVRRLADTDDDRRSVHYSEKTRTALPPRILALDSSVSPLICRSIDAAECGHDPSWWG